MNVCICAWVFVYLGVHVFVRACVCTCMRVCSSEHVCLCVFVLVYVWRSRGRSALYIVIYLSTLVVRAAQLSNRILKSWLDGQLQESFAVEPFAVELKEEHQNNS